MTLNEQLKQLADQLVKEGMNTTTLEESSYLTLDGLVQAMDQDPPQYGSVDDFRSLANALVSSGILPVITNMVNGVPHYVFAISAHDLSSEKRKLREAVSISVTVDSIFNFIDFPYQKNSPNITWLLLSSFLPQTEAEKGEKNDHAAGTNDYEELLRSGAIFGHDKRLLFLNGVNSESTSVQRMCAIINNAIRQGASDIHIQPDPNLEIGLGGAATTPHALDDPLDLSNKIVDTSRGGRVRYRVKGRLVESKALFTRRNIGGMIAVIKIWMNRRIDGHLENLDARISFTPEIIKAYPKFADYDLRVSIAVTIHGENAVLRLLRRGSKVFSLRDCGLPNELEAQLQRKVNSPHGIILITGPTGSGKTTTLYGALGTINDPTRHIITIEDPVEIQMGGLTQMQINPEMEKLNFANYLKTSLRQDPDVILLGEIRDSETAQIAIRASMTGHLLLATLHTNSALDAVTRLVDMGIPGYLVADNLRMVMAQRLVRRLCSHCRERYNGHDDLKILLGKDLRKGFEKEFAFDKDIWIWRPVTGRRCPECHGTGYSDRQLLAEGFAPSPEAKVLISGGSANQQKLYEIAVNGGFRSMAFSSVVAVVEGKTTIEEILRAATEDEFLRDGPTLIAPALNNYLKKNPQKI